MIFKTWIWCIGVGFACFLLTDCSNKAQHQPVIEQRDLFLETLLTCTNGNGFTIWLDTNDYYVVCKRVKAVEFFKQFSTQKE